ncbi:MAG: cyclopropane-fatty-acyl-phospholipid synthase family protein [Novosphingobium sp.]
MLSALIRQGRLVVTDYDGKSYEYGDPAATPLTVRFTDKGTALHIAKDPRMGAGEAYTDGRLVVEPPHDVRDFVLFVMNQANREDGALKPKGLARQLIDRAGSKLDQINLRSRSSSNVLHHYGLTRQFYELFLDEDRQYSMAYFRDPANSLERAQIDKKALVAAKLNLGPNMRVLDIGCGWGGLGLYMNRHFGCEVLGVSLAPDQVAFANERAAAAGVADKVKFQLIDYRDVTGTFDRISSIGMIEHLGLPHYGEYFGKTFDLLADNGVMLTHTIGRSGAQGATDKWARTYIFPGHHLPAISEVVTATERAGWRVADFEVLRMHYAYTLAEWYRRTTMHKTEIVKLFDERMFRMWQFYLVGCEQGFRSGNLVNFHVQTVKRLGNLPMTRDYIQQETARLSALDGAPAWHLENGGQ